MTKIALDDMDHLEEANEWLRKAMGSVRGSPRFAHIKESALIAIGHALVASAEADIERAEAGRILADVFKEGVTEEE